MKKILSITISIMMISVFLFSGCGNKTSNEVPTEKAEVSFAEDVVAIAGDYEITKDEVDVYIGLLVSYIQYQTGSEEGWEDIIVEDGKTARDILIEYAIEEAKYQHVFSTLAMEDGYYTTEDDEMFYEEYIEGNGGREEYESFLAEYGFTDEAFRKYISATGAYYSIATEEQAAAVYDSEYVTAKHILITFEGRDSEDVAYEEAMMAYNRAVAGESFEALIEELNEDPGEDAETGYTFGEGEMVDEFYQGSLALQIGEISKPVKTSYGYHVIKRYPLPEKGTAEYESYISTIMNSLASQYASSEAMNTKLEEYTLYINEDILDEIDLSRYTTTSSAE